MKKIITIITLIFAVPNSYSEVIPGKDAVLYKDKNAAVPARVQSKLSPLKIRSISSVFPVARFSSCSIFSFSAIRFNKSSKRAAIGALRFLYNRVSLFSVHSAFTAKTIKDKIIAINVIFIL